MLILDEFVQVDKSDAEISVTYFSVNLFVVILCCQIETETGTVVRHAHQPQGSNLSGICLTYTT